VTRAALVVASLLLAPAAIAAASLGADDGAKKPPAKLLVRAGRIYTAAPEGGKVAPFFAPGAMLLVDGKVAEVASSIEKPVDAELLDLGDAVVMPGIVDASTTLAGTSDYLPQGLVWKDEAIAAHYDPCDSFDRFADRTATLLGGVTTVYLSCGEERLISGQGAVAKLASREGGAVLLAQKVALEVNLGESSLDPPERVEPPLPPSADNPIKPGEPQLPTTRLGQILGVREAFARAKEPSSGDLPLAALREAIDARRTIRIAAEEAADLLRAVQLARELGQPAVVVGAAEGALVAEQLAAARYPVIVEIALTLQRPPEDRRIDVDTPRLRPETPAELVRRGVKVALATPAGRDPADALLAGAVALRGGLTTEQAVAALTRVPAEILGVGHRVGCLMPGKDGDFLVLSGEPFLRGSHVQSTWVEGRLAAEVASASARAGSSRSIVLRAGTVLTAVGEPIKNGAVVIEDGRIVAVGPDVGVPRDARVLDAGANAVITPGFLDGNSHLELAEDRTNLSLDFDLAQIVAFAGEDALEVARHGVTTAIVQTWQAHQSGSRAIAVKTAGTTRSQRLVDPLAAVKHFWRGPFDPIGTEERYRNELRRAKDYADRWTKYADDLKKWEEEQRKKTPEQLAAEKAKAEADAKKKEEPATPETEKEKKADPVTGKWEVTISGGPIAEPQQGVMRLKLEGDKVSGSLAALFGDEEDPTALSGSLSGKHLALELDVQTQLGKPTIDGDLDADDHLTAKLKLGQAFAFDFVGKRTEKEYVEVTVQKKKKAKGPEGKPQPPDAAPELEPYRRVFAGEAPILLECDSAIGIRHALKVFAEFKLEVVLLGADELTRLPREEWRSVVKGVVVPAEIEVTRAGKPVVPAAELSRMGVPVAFQSGGINSARGLALNAAYAVRLGLDPRKALEALTIDCARLFHVQDQVGSLEVGKQADVLVFSGDPFELSTRLLRVFVGGEELSLEMKP
jgi:imidazolonepropionase-like amidohydrolase